MEINLKPSDTEQENIERFDQFILAVTPKWFNWIGWLLILGALFVLKEKADSFVVNIISGISVGLITAYFMCYFYKFTFKNIPFIKSKAKVRLASLLVSGALSLMFLLLFQAVVDVLGKI